MQATLIDNQQTCQYLERLRDAERHLIDALGAARESVARCEQALNALAEARMRVEAERLAPAGAGAGHAPVTLNGHDNGCRAVRRTDSLTAREAEVLRLIAAGHSNREIADGLFISPRTIERHIANIYLKIDAHNKTEATAYALRHGLA